MTEQNEEIREFASELEWKVEERTMELQESRAELEKKNVKLREVTRELKSARDRYRNLYNWAPLGYLSLDNDFTIREINITGAHLLGARRAELLGKSIGNFLSPENAALLADAFEKCTEEEHTHLELQLTIQGEKCLFVNVHCEPYRQQGLEVNLYRTAVIDITKLKEAEDKLHRLNRLYAMLSGTGKAIVHASREEELFREVCRVAVQEGEFVQACIGMAVPGSGRIQQVAVFGRDGEESRHPCICLGHRIDDPGPVIAAVRSKSHYVSNDSQNDPHARFCVQFSRFRSIATFALTRGGEGVGAFSISSDQAHYFDPDMVDLLKQMADDISFALENMESEHQRRQAEEALRRETLERLKAVEELREKEQLLLQQNRLAAMGEMIGNIAHQWRQPLNVLGLLVQELPIVHGIGTLNEEYLQKSVAKAMEVIGHMSSTIDDFRSFFQPDKEAVRFPMNEPVGKAVSLVAAAFKAHNISVEVVGEDLPVRGYPNQFSQVVLNLLMNARDVFLERNVPGPTVRIALSDENGLAVMTVADNGGGIPAGMLERIFEPYFTTKGPEKGTGIGLFMAKTIIEKNMGGRLTARNTGEGAEFRIEMPRDP